MEIAVDTLSRAEWDAALGPDQPLQQSWAYGAVMRALGAQVLRAAVDGGTRQQVAQLMYRRGWFGGMAVLNRSLLTSGAALAALRRALPGTAVPVLMTSTETGTRPRGSVPVLTPAHVAELNISRAEADLLAAMAGKWRNRMRAGVRAGLHLERRHEAPGWLLRAEARQQAERGYRGLPPEFARLWGDYAPLSCFIARAGGKPLAAMLFLHHGGWATYQIGWCGDQGRRCGAHPWILWQAMQVLKAEGVTRIDLGAIATDTAPGLARFKLGAGAQVRALGHTCAIVPGSGLRPGRAARARFAAPPPAPRW